MDVSSLTVSLPADGTVPEWVHVLPAGTFSGDDGRGPYQVKDAAQVIAASMMALKLPVDENHSTQLATQQGNPSPARGWIVELQNRADGVWGRVDWNDAGQALMTSKAYRGISPVFGYEKDGTVTRVISVALTNSPNLSQLKTLHTSRKTGDDMDIKKIRELLGLPETADEAAVLTAIGKGKETVAAHTAEIERLKASTAPVDQVVALQTKLATMEAERAQDKATTFIDAAIKAGKPIVAVREQYIAQHVASPAATEALINGLPSINSRGAGGGNPPAGGGGEELSGEELAICTKMGTDPKKMAELKKKQAGEGSAV